METLYTPAEVAEQLKLKKTTVYDLIKRGELPSSKVGKQFRISSSDLERYLKNTVHSNIESEESTSVNIDSNNEKTVISGQSSLLDIMCTMGDFHSDSPSFLRSYLNSYHSLTSLYFKKVQIAAVSLWNEDRKEFDFSIPQHFIPGIPCGVYHICKYKLGFYVQKDNPKKISKDNILTKKSLSIINREPGCESRILMDQLMMNYNEIGKGVVNECTSHQAVASYVSSHQADLGIGDESTAKTYEQLTFIPLKTVSLDLIYLKEFELSPEFSLLNDFLQSDVFLTYLSQQDSYDTECIGKLK